MSKFSLKSYTQRKIDYLHYRIDQYFSSRFALQLFIAFLLVLAALGIFYIIALFLNVDPGGQLSLLWWVSNHLLDSYWEEAGVVEQVLATLLTLFNFLVFATVIGLVASKVQLRLESMKYGVSTIYERNHIVIIGWSAKVFSIISELQQGLEHEHPVFAVLTRHDPEETEKALKRKFKPYRRNRRRQPLPHVKWIVRQGSPTSIDDLEMLSLHEARAIIVLHPDESGFSGDSQVIKTVMAVRNVLSGYDDHSVKTLIAEIDSLALKPQVEAAAVDLPINIIQSSDLLGKIILQAARQKNLVDVYNELLTHEGNEFYHVPVEDGSPLIGKPWADIVSAFPRAIPIGIRKTGKSTDWTSPNGLKLLPHVQPDFVLTPGNALVVIAPDATAAGEITKPRPVNDALRKPDVETEDSMSQRVSSLLVLGYNEKAIPMLQEFAGYAQDIDKKFFATLVSPFLPSNIERMLSTSAPGREAISSHLDLTYRREEYMLPEFIDSLDVDRFDAVVVLGEHGPGATTEEADTRVIMTLLLLRHARQASAGTGKAAHTHQQIVYEILDPANKELALTSEYAEDVIISNNVISNLIAQICRDPLISEIIEDLLNREGAEIYLKPASLYRNGNELTFEAILNASLHRNETAIGLAYSRDITPGRHIIINPPKGFGIQIDHETHVIVLAETEL